MYIYVPIYVYVLTWQTNPQGNQDSNCLKILRKCSFETFVVQKLISFSSLLSPYLRLLLEDSIKNHICRQKLQETGKGYYRLK